MLQSHVVDVDGTFVGAAVRLDRGYRFVALDIRVEELDGQIHPTLADVTKLARRLFLSGSFAGRGSLVAGTAGSVAQPARRALVSGNHRREVEYRDGAVLDQPATSHHYAIRAA